MESSTALIESLELFPTAPGHQKAVITTRCEAHAVTLASHAEELCDHLARTLVHRPSSVEIWCQGKKLFAFPMENVVVR